MPSPTETGRRAEDRAAQYLEAQGFALLARNWRNRFCELDIVARRDDTVHIIEVKYRRSTTWGYAAEYINYDKIQRLKRAALAWRQASGHHDAYQIDLISVEGDLNSPRVVYLPNAISD
jgi:putative endonuclease